MDNIQTALIIKELCKKQKVTISRMLLDTSIRKGLIYDMEKRDLTPSAEVLEKIADYFDCSVDYLLGRVDTPNMSNRVDNSVLINGSINNNSHSTLNVATPPQDEMMQQLINGFKTLSFENKLKIMNALFELKKEN